jgi:putative hydrolase of HD superfamily
MDSKSLLSFLSVAEKLKCNLRHSWTSSKRQESVAEHSWRLCVFSWAVKKDFPDYDMDKVLLMCLFHDIGEAVTGDIPAFLKTQQHENDETAAIGTILNMLDPSAQNELIELFTEMQEQKTNEARLFKALDKLEAVIQHNEAPLETWIPLEYELNLTYADEEVKEISPLEILRNEIRDVTLRLIEKNTGKKDIENY